VPGVAVKLTDVPEVKFAEHALGGAGFAQLISGVTVGNEVLVSVPLPVNATVKLLVCAVNTAVTVCALLIVTAHFAGCPTGTTHGGVLQLVKFDVVFGTAVSVVIDPLKMLSEQTPVGVVVPFNTQSRIVPVPPMFPLTVPPPVAFAPGITFTAKFPVPLLNVAVISSCASTVNAQVAVAPAHVALPIATPHAANTEPGFAACVNITCVPLGYVVLHVPVGPCPVLFVQLICPKLSVTVPYAVPSSTSWNGSPVAAGTVMVTLGIVVPASVALIVVVIPAPTALTSPLELTVAAAGFEEAHVTLLVKS
jgi:hypothetical protein